MLERRQKVLIFAEIVGCFSSLSSEVLARVDAGTETSSCFLTIIHQQMLSIHETALRLDLADIAKIAGLAVQVSVAAHGARTNYQVRRCHDSLWDAVTTVRFMLESASENTPENANEECNTLITRLEAVLRSLDVVKRRSLEVFEREAKNIQGD